MQALHMLISSPWFWVSMALSGLGGVIVAWGLRVEKLAERKLPPSDFKTDIFEDVVGEAKRGIERGWRILMAGIIIEVVAAFGISIISGLEVASLTLEARRAESKANDAALQVEIVRSNNVVLQQRLQPRTISIEQITNFIFLTQNMPKFPVRVGIGKINDEVFSYAMQIQSMLKQADYTTPNADTNWIEGIHQDDTAFMVPNRAVGSGLFDPKREWPNISLYVDDPSGGPENPFFTKNTNGLALPGMVSNTNFAAALIFVFREVGIKCDWGYKPEWTGTNHFEIFVHPKS